jgi:3-hydroxyisobutyrate dehydrogenase-like beta-hydroxyacid dehydrogenase
MATKNAQKIGWIGMGRMGFPMAERLIKAGHDVTIWNRTRAKAEPLAKIGGKVVDHLYELKDVDVLFSIVATGKDVQDVLYGKNGVCSQGGKMPPIVVDCSTIAVEESAAIRDKLKQLGADFVASPVSGNAKVIKAGKLSAVVSGPEAACNAADRSVRAARRILCRRRRARPRLQDRPQCHARRRHREPNRDHASDQQNGRAAPRFPRLPQQRRDGLDVHRL